MPQPQRRGAHRQAPGWRRALPGQGARGPESARARWRARSRRAAAPHPPRSGYLPRRRLRRARCVAPPAPSPRAGRCRSRGRPLGHAPHRPACRAPRSAGARRARDRPPCRAAWTFRSSGAAVSPRNRFQTPCAPPMAAPANAPNAMSVTTSAKPTSSPNWLREVTRKGCATAATDRALDSTRDRPATDLAEPGDARGAESGTDPRDEVDGIGCRTGDPGDEAERAVERAGLALFDQPAVIGVLVERLGRRARPARRHLLVERDRRTEARGLAPLLGRQRRLAFDSGVRAVDLRADLAGDRRPETLAGLCAKILAQRRLEGFHAGEDSGVGRRRAPSRARG